MKKKCIVLLLSLVLAISLCACGSDEQNSTEPTETSSVETTEEFDDSIPWEEAGEYIGEHVTVVGEIVDAYQATDSNGSPTFIDMGASYPDSNRVTLLIWEENLYNFDDDPETMYMGETVAVTGTVSTYDGTIQIEVTDPSQIEIR